MRTRPAAFVGFAVATCAASTCAVTVPDYTLTGAGAAASSGTTTSTLSSSSSGQGGGGFTSTGTTTSTISSSSSGQGGGGFTSTGTTGSTTSASTGAAGACTDALGCDAGPCDICVPNSSLCLAPLTPLASLPGPCERALDACNPSDTATCGPVGAYGGFSYPRGIAFDGTNMWIANNSGNNVTALSLSGATLGTFPVGSSPYGIAFDGTHMWVTNYGGNSVTKL